jgi:hypothetical protein
MRRPRLRLASEDPGGAGTPPGTTTGPCREPADGAVANRPPSRKRGPAPEGERRDGAPAGASLFARGSTPQGVNLKTLRRPALRPLRPGRRERACPREGGEGRPATPGRKQQGRCRLPAFAKASAGSLLQPRLASRSSAGAKAGRKQQGRIRSLWRAGTNKALGCLAIESAPVAVRCHHYPHRTAL